MTSIKKKKNDICDFLSFFLIIIKSWSDFFSGPHIRLSFQVLPVLTTTRQDIVCRPISCIDRLRMKHLTFMLHP